MMTLFAAVRLSPTPPHLVLISMTRGLLSSGAVNSWTTASRSSCFIEPI